MHCWTAAPPAWTNLCYCTAHTTAFCLLCLVLMGGTTWDCLQDSFSALTCTPLISLTVTPADTWEDWTPAAQADHLCYALPAVILDYLLTPPAHCLFLLLLTQITTTSLGYRDPRIPASTSATYLLLGLPRDCCVNKTLPPGTAQFRSTLPGFLSLVQFWEWIHYLT